MARKGVKKSIRAAAKSIGFVSVSQDYRWRQLLKLEERRRQVLLRVEDPVWLTLLRYDGTVFQILRSDWLFWLTISIYIGVRMVAHFGELPESLATFPADSITVIGGFLSFFLVFWVNQSHSRYFSLYGSSMACKGRIFDAATMAVTTLPYAQAARLIRYMNAAHAAGYVGLSEVYPSENYFNHVNETMGLITEQERERLDHIDLDKGGCCYREIIVWCMNEVEDARKKGYLTEYLAHDLREQVIQLRVQMGALYNAKDLPIPFFYVHFMSVLNFFYLPLFALTSSIQVGPGTWQTTWTAGLIRGLIVILQAIFVIGLRVLGQKLMDPYGDDLIDLSVMHYVRFTWIMSNRILNSHFPEEASAEVENAMRDARSDDLGEPWMEQEVNDDEVKTNSGNHRATQEDLDLEAQIFTRQSRRISNPSFARRAVERVDQSVAAWPHSDSRTISNPPMESRSVESGDDSVATPRYDSRMMTNPPLESTHSRESPQRNGSGTPTNSRKTTTNPSSPSLRSPSFESEYSMSSPTRYDSRPTSTPSLGSQSFESAHSSASRSGIGFHPALRESDWSMVAL